MQEVLLMIQQLCDEIIKETKTVPVTSTLKKTVLTK